MERESATAPLVDPRDFDTINGYTKSEYNSNVTNYPVPSWWLYVVAGLSLFGGFQFGWHTGVLNLPENSVISDLKMDEYGDHVVLWSVIVSMFTLGGMVGAQSGGYIADALGRRSWLVWSGVVFVLQGVLQFMAGQKGLRGPAGYGLLAVGRFLSGFGSGGASVIGPLYLGEIAPQHMRGTFGTLAQFAVVIGIVASQLLYLAVTADPGTYLKKNLPSDAAPYATNWPILLLISAVLGGVQVAMCLMMPESPRYLLAQGRQQEAQKSLQQLRDTTAPGAGNKISRELELLQREAAQGQDEEAPSLWQVLGDQRLRRSLTIMLVLTIAQQLSGINVVFYYSSDTFQKAGVAAVAGSLLASVVNALATVLAVVMIESCGRRILLIIGAGSMLVSQVLLTVFLITKKDAKGSAVDALNWLAIAMVLIFVAGFEIGLGAIPWMIGGDLFPSKPRATAMSFGALCNWLANLAVGLGFLPMQSALGPYSFLPFAVILGLTFVFILVFVPETKNKSVTQVLAELNGEEAQAEEGSGLDPADLEQKHLLSREDIEDVRNGGRVDGDF